MLKLQKNVLQDNEAEKRKKKRRPPPKPFDPEAIRAIGNFASNAAPSLINHPII